MPEQIIAKQRILDAHRAACQSLGPMAAAEAVARELNLGVVTVENVIWGREAMHSAMEQAA